MSLTHTSDIPELPPEGERRSGTGLRRRWDEVPDSLGLQVTLDDGVHLAVRAYAGPRYAVPFDVGGAELTLDTEKKRALVDAVGADPFFRHTDVAQRALERAEAIAAAKHGIRQFHTHLTYPEALTPEERDVLVAFYTRAGYQVQRWDRPGATEPPPEANVFARAVKDLEAAREVGELPPSAWRELGEREPPDTLELPPDIQATMDRLWDRSVAHWEGGKVNEYGGTLVLDQAGRLQLSHIVRGTDSSVRLLPPAPGETLVGFFHTHPYEKLELNAMPFSGVDIAETINKGARIHLVQSGDRVFALVRTPETAMAADPEDMERKLDVLSRDYSRRGLSACEAELAANLDLAEAHGLAFYASRRGDKLVRWRTR